VTPCSHIGVFSQVQLLPRSPPHATCGYNLVASLSPPPKVVLRGTVQPFPLPLHGRRSALSDSTSFSWPEPSPQGRVLPLEGLKLRLLRPLLPFPQNTPPFSTRPYPQTPSGRPWLPRLAPYVNGPGSSRPGGAYFPPRPRGLTFSSDCFSRDESPPFFDWSSQPLPTIFRYLKSSLLQGLPWFWPHRWKLLPCCDGQHRSTFLLGGGHSCPNGGLTELNKRSFWDCFPLRDFR